MRPANWRTLLKANTRQLRDLSWRIAQQTDPIELLRLHQRANQLLDERSRLTAQASPQTVGEHQQAA